MPSRRLKPEEKRDRFLKMAQDGADDFLRTRAVLPLAVDSRLAPSPQLAPAPPAPATEEDEVVLGDTSGVAPPPETPEVYSFEEPKPSRKGYRKRGWGQVTILIDPRVLSAANILAAELGVPITELHNMALGLIVDPKKRLTPTQELFDRVRERFR